MSGLINEANFSLVIIALLLIAFILGFLVGKVFSRQNESRSNAGRTDSGNINENPQLASPAEQDTYQKMNTVNSQVNRTCDPRYRYFYYW